MKINLSLLLTAVILFWNACFLYASENKFMSLGDEERSARITQAFTALEEKTFTGVLGVTIGQEPHFLRRFGRLRDSGLEADRIQVDILSITKTVTAVMVLTLMESGKLTLDQTLSDFFVDLPDDKANITLHQLLTHSSGFRESLGRDDEKINRQDYVRKAMRSRLRFRPGTGYSYSNIGYSLLAAIVELASQMSYEEYLADVLGSGNDVSIGYANSFNPVYSLTDAAGRDISSLSWGHDRAYWNLIGNGGLVATVKDMLEFRRMVNAGDIISQESLDLLHTPHQQEVPDDTFYGYGVVVDQNSVYGNFLWHNGGNNVFSSYWAYLLDHEISVFVAVTGKEDADSVAEKFLNALLKQER